MTTETKKFLFKDGHEIQPNWLSEFELEGATIIKASRKNCSCAFGCRINEKSSYLNLRVKHCAGCAGGMVKLALCRNHFELLKKDKQADWLDILDFDDVISLLENSTGLEK